MAVLRVKEPFACDVGGVQRVYRIGDLVPVGDPIVTPARRMFFEDGDVVAARALGPVEQATAEPGRRRAMRAVVGKSDSEGMSNA